MVISITWIASRWGRSCQYWRWSSPAKKSAAPSRVGTSWKPSWMCCRATTNSRMRCLPAPVYWAMISRPRKLLPSLKFTPTSLIILQALQIGRRLFGENQIHSFTHLGVYRLLFHLDRQSELRDFYRETLGPLLHTDTRGDSTLIDTLEGYFRCNGNLSETARTMHLHRNSLLYRLGRIEEVLGQSLDDSELRLSLQIALKI